MEINQQHLRMLLKQTDVAYEQLKQHPDSAEYVARYDHAKTALDAYFVSMRQALTSKASRK